MTSSTLADLVGRNTVTPPQLAGDAPRLDVLQPVEPNDLVRIGCQNKLLAADGSDRFGGHRCAVHEPLGHQHWLDDVIRTAAAANAVLMRRHVTQQAHLVQLCDNRLAALEAVHPLEGTFHGNVTLQVKDVDTGEVVANTRLKIVRVMCRRDLDAASTEVHVDQRGVQDDRDRVVTEGALDLHPVVLRVAGVLGVDGHSRITQNGFGSGRNDDPSSVPTILYVTCQYPYDLLVVP